MNTTPHIVLAGGGTAGHVNPLLAVADAIRTLAPRSQISVIGTAVGLEHDLVPQAGYELDTIDKVPFPRKPNAAALHFLSDLRRENKDVKNILTRREAQVVVGFGGYVSAPVYRAAHTMHLPIVVHEQNASAGMANKLGSKWARYIGTAYEHTGLKPGPSSVIERVGLPLRAAIARLCSHMEQDRSAVRLKCAKELGMDPSRPIIVVTGGSLGAVSLNRAVAGAAEDLLKQHAQVIHLTGRHKGDEVRSTVADAISEHMVNDLSPEHTGLGDYHVAEYLERIDLAFGCADMVICRSGAGSVSELAAIGLPAVYVPLPIGNGEQRFNAQPVVDAGGGILVDDHEFTDAWVREHIPTILADGSRLRDMREAAWNYGIRDAAQVMAHHVLELV